MVCLNVDFKREVVISEVCFGGSNFGLTGERQEESFSEWSSLQADFRLRESFSVAIVARGFSLNLHRT